MGKKKLAPKPWPRLTETALLPSPPASFETCQLCGKPGAFMLYECDDDDEPERDRVLVTCGRKSCRKEISAHPRLYVDLGLGYPGHFPKLCPPCKLRDGVKCTHPDLKTNGGGGLMISVSGYQGHVCGRGSGGCRELPRTAEKCAGRQLLQLVP